MRRREEIFHLPLKKVSFELTLELGVKAVGHLLKVFRFDKILYVMAQAQSVQQDNQGCQ